MIITLITTALNNDDDYTNNSNNRYGPRRRDRVRGALLMEKSFEISNFAKASSGFDREKDTEMSKVLLVLVLLLEVSLLLSLLSLVLLLLLLLLVLVLLLVVVVVSSKARGAVTVSEGPATSGVRSSMFLARTHYHY